MRYWAQLKVDQRTYGERLNRMRHLIDVNASPVAVWMSARLVLDSMHYPLHIRWQRWCSRNLPHWVLWLISAQHRMVMRELRGMESDDAFPTLRNANEGLMLFVIAEAVVGLAVLCIWLYGHYRMGW